VLILIGWVIFANDSPAVLGAYFKSLIGLNGGFFSSLTLHYLRNYAAVLIISVIGATEVPKKIAVHIKNEKASAALKLISGILIFALCICFILGDSYNPFLYFRF
jgi:alginate O-acetyltransferase complex protein AlgI